MALQRVPEPELMIEPEQVAAYAREDFSAANSLFMSLFFDYFPELVPTGKVLDLGCGPADIACRFAEAHPACSVDALDGSEPMLAFGRKAVNARGLQNRVRLVLDRIPSAQLPRGVYDVILSNSLLHHLGEPEVLWRTLGAAGRPGAAVLVMDLARPDSPQAVERIVDRYAAASPPVLRRDFRASLFAAFSVEEVTEQLRRGGLDSLIARTVSDRHLAVSGFLPR